MQQHKALPARAAPQGEPGFGDAGRAQGKKQGEQGEEGSCSRPARGARIT